MKAISNFCLKYMWVIVALVAALLLPTAHAAERVTFDGLTDEQAQQVRIQIEQLRAETLAEQRKTPAKQEVPPAVEQAAKWAELGKNIGVGLGAAAKEVGLAVNDFAKTDVGKVTTFVIVYKLVGKDVLVVSFGILVLLIGITVAVVMYRTGTKTITTYAPVTFFKVFTFMRKTSSETGVIRDRELILMGTIMLVASVAVCTVCIATR